MSEYADAIRELGDCGVIRAFQWAWGSARKSTLKSFDPKTGHDQGWLGYTAYKIFTARLDRVFSTGHFEVRSNQSQAERQLLVSTGLSETEYLTMPTLPSGLVVHDDLNGSQGWRRENWRTLLQSFGGQHVDRIMWSQKSQTKRGVARQPDPDQQPLPRDVLDLRMAADLGDEIFAPPETAHQAVTLVCAYAIHLASGETELHLGRPRQNRRGEKAWYWRKRIDPGGDNDGDEGGVLQPSRAPSPLPADKLTL
ncbi:hypothetical protein [Actinopolymorpha singaporensis]|nr:hypothetical protein [Actinopolymorpha singaporensis]